MVSIENAGQKSRSAEPRRMTTKDILDKEQRWNENCVLQKKKLYAAKYKLQPKNTFHNLFSSINDGIRHEIEVNEKRILYDTDDKNYFFILNRYNKIYLRSSNEVLKMLKTQQATTLKSFAINTANCMQMIKEADIKTLVRRRSRKEVNAPQSKVDKHRSEPLLALKFDKIASQLRTQSQNLKRKLNERENKTLQPLSLLSDQMSNHMNKKYSKNAYLASLNYDFTNPLV